MVLVAPRYALGPSYLPFCSTSIFLPRPALSLLPAVCSQIQNLPVVFVSSVTGEGLHELMETVVAVHDSWAQMLPPKRLSAWLKQVRWQIGVCEEWWLCTAK